MPTRWWSGEQLIIGPRQAWVNSDDMLDPESMPPSRRSESCPCACLLPSLFAGAVPSAKLHDGLWRSVKTKNSFFSFFCSLFGKLASGVDRPEGLQNYHFISRIFMHERGKKVIVFSWLGDEFICSASGWGVILAHKEKRERDPFLRWAVEGIGTSLWVFC